MFFFFIGKNYFPKIWDSFIFFDEFRKFDQFYKEKEDKKKLHLLCDNNFCIIFTGFANCAKPLWKTNK